MAIVRVHVAPADSGWDVRLQAEVVATAPDSGEAELAAREYLMAHGGGEMIVHLTDRRAPKVVRVGQSGGSPTSRSTTTG